MAAIYPTKDTYLAEASSQLGLATTMACGQIVVFATPVRSRILISFDLSSYGGVAIASAWLTLKLINAAFIDAPHDASAYEVTKDWIEGEESWHLAATGDPWATEGGDTTGSPFATASIANGDTTLNISLLPLVLQKRGGAMNIMLRLPEGSGHDNHFFTCHSREAALEANRPVLLLGSAVTCVTISDRPVTNLVTSDSW